MRGGGTQPSRGEKLAGWRDRHFAGLADRNGLEIDGYDWLDHDGVGWCGLPPLVAPTKRLDSASRSARWEAEGDIAGNATGAAAATEWRSQADRGGRHRPCRRRRGPNGRDGRRSGAVSGRGDHPSSRQQTSRGTCRKRPTERLPGPGSPRPPAVPVRRQRATGDRSVVFTSGACAARARTCAGVRGGRPRGGPGAIRLTPVNNHSFVF